MKTNLSRAHKLVLIDKYDKIMAIISVEKGLQNIISKVEQAIREDMSSKNVIISQGLIIRDKHLYDIGYVFDAVVIDQEGEKELYNFNLISATEY